MTLGNTKNIDILVFDPMTKKAYQVEVKTNHERRNGPTDSKFFGKFVTSWQMHEKHEQIKALISFIASFISTTAARIPQELISILHCAERRCRGIPTE